MSNNLTNSPAPVTERPRCIICDWPYAETTARIELHPDKNGRYRFRIRSKNGQITATSGERFFTGKSNARRAAKALLKSLGAEGVEIREVER